MRPFDESHCWRLPLVPQPQQTSFYCGPAVVAIALAMLLPDPPTQRMLASSDALQTDLNGETNRHRICEIVNRYLGGGTYQVNDLSRPATTEERGQFTRDLRRSARAGAPLLCSLEVMPGGPRPHQGYPQDRVIEHHVAVHGYYDAGERVLVSDPAGKSPAVTWGHAVPVEYTVSTDTLIAVTMAYLAVGEH